MENTTTSDPEEILRHIQSLNPFVTMDTIAPKVPFLKSGAIKFIKGHGFVYGPNSGDSSLRVGMKEAHEEYVKRMQVAMAKAKSK